MKHKTVIFDLDGTLADLNGRSPYGEAQAECVNDLCREPIANLTRMYASVGYGVLIVSGRFDTYSAQTMRWLNTHRIPCWDIFMREAGDQRADEIVKREIYERDIEPFYNVEMVYDDRLKICNMWTELGLLVANVGNCKDF